MNDFDLICSEFLLKKRHKEQLVTFLMCSPHRGQRLWQNFTPRTLAGRRDWSLPPKPWAGAPHSCCECHYKQISSFIRRPDHQTGSWTCPAVFSSSLPETRRTGSWVKTGDMRNLSPARMRSPGALRSWLLPQRYRKASCRSKIRSVLFCLPFSDRTI